MFIPNKESEKVKRKMQKKLSQVILCHNRDRLKTGIKSNYE